MTEIKPCPACRSTRAYVMRSLIEMTAVGGRPNVQCLDCGCLGPIAETSDEAVRAWNAIPRKTPPATTLRDEFAMAALPGVLTWINQSGRDVLSGGVAVFAAEMSYATADAMMKEREKDDG